MERTLRDISYIFANLNDGALLDQKLAFMQKGAVQVYLLLQTAESEETRAQARTGLHEFCRALGPLYLHSAPSSPKLCDLPIYLLLANTVWGPWKNKTTM